MINSTILNKNRLKQAALALLMLVCFNSNALAQWTQTWESPAMGYNYFANQLRITKVEMNAKNTTISFHMWYPPKAETGFPKTTMLRADGKEYVAQSSTVVTLDESLKMPESGHIDFTITFAPFPKGTKSFDLVVPGSFTITNIHDRQQPTQGLNDTYWRNAATGDWLIGFTENTVIYDSKFWDIANVTEKKDKFEYIIRSGDTELRINVSKEKKGIRKIGIGEEKAIVCERITSRFMPPYPIKDTRTALADNNYSMGDSVTIIGWYKDMNEDALNEGREFTAGVSHLCLPDEEIFSVPFDSLGRFTLRIPVHNTCELRPDWSVACCNCCSNRAKPTFC